MQQKLAGIIIGTPVLLVYGIIFWWTPFKLGGGLIAAGGMHLLVVFFVAMAWATTHLNGDY